jgi:heme exporter protein D
MKKVIYISGTIALAMFLVLAGAPSAEAQTANTLMCLPLSSNVLVGQNVTLQAVGGDGNYIWSAAGMTPQAGSSLTVNYATVGNASISVTSGGQTATCQISILAGDNTGLVLGSGTLSCGPATRSVLPSQITTFTATGGTGSYVWTAPQMAAQSGATLSVFYPIAGSSSVTVTSGAESATCLVTILGATTPGTSPGLPNTGMGGGALLLNSGILLGLSGMATMIARKRISK